MVIEQRLTPDIVDVAHTEPWAAELPAGQPTAVTGPGSSEPDFVTVLTAKGHRLTKKIWLGADRKSWWFSNYDKPLYFDFEATPVAGLEDIKRVLDEVGPELCLILGRLKDGVNPNGALRRLHDRKLDDGTVEPATIEDTAHYWLPIDVDSLAARDEDGEFKPIVQPTRAVRCVVQRLPPEFQVADCVWQFTSTAGFKPGIRMRLYFWLSRPLTGAEMKIWLGSCAVVDPSIFRPVQPIYAAPPVIEGLRDPVPQRTGALYQSGPVTPPEAIHVNLPKKAKVSGSTLKAHDAGVDGGDREGGTRKPTGYPICGPEIVEYDEPETLSWAIEMIQADLAAYGLPEIGKNSDNRAYGLVGKLRDGPAWGQSLKPEMIADLLHEHWAPHFDLSWLLMKANGTYRNDPGVGPAGAGRLFGTEAEEYSSGPLDVVLGDPLAGVADPEPSEGEQAPGNPAAGSASASPSISPTTSPAAAAPILPPLRLGSDVDISKCVARYLRQQHGEVLFDEGRFWFYDKTHWRPIEDHNLRRAVHGYDGATIFGTPTRVKLGKHRVDSVLNEMKAILAHPAFFSNAAVGINCATGFITFSGNGEPSLTPHASAHRCRHVLSGSWDDGIITEAEQLFLIFQALGGTLLAQLLQGLFLGDPDAAEKRQLLAEIAGAAALGYGTKAFQPKAVILEGKTAENGKSQVLDLFRGLLPTEAVASIPAAKMSDERFVVGLVGKHLNASDELSGAEAIAGDVFKAAITGEPVTGRDVYRSAVTFRPIAQHVFATNTLPGFKGGIDRGVRRRLLVLTFNRTIPKDERIENIGLRIAEQEADILLWWAVAGASQLIRRRGFTTPMSCEAALREWLLGSDPVVAWGEACIEIVDANAEAALTKRNAAYDHFAAWAKREGFSERTLPGLATFVNRLRAHAPAIKPKHTSSGNFLTGFRIKRTEEGLQDDEFPFDAPVSRLSGEPG